MYSISSQVAFLTGWPCTASDALKSPCRAVQGSVTDDQGAAVEENEQRGDTTAIQSRARIKLVSVTLLRADQWTGCT